MSLERQLFYTCILMYIRAFNLQLLNVCSIKDIFGFFTNNGKVVP